MSASPDRGGRPPTAVTLAAVGAVMLAAPPIFYGMVMGTRPAHDTPFVGMAIASFVFAGALLSVGVVELRSVEGWVRWVGRYGTAVYALRGAGAALPLLLARDSYGGGDAYVALLTACSLVLTLGLAVAMTRQLLYGYAVLAVLTAVFGTFALT